MSAVILGGTKWKWIRRINPNSWNRFTVCAVAPVAFFALALVGALGVVTSGEPTALVGSRCTFVNVMTLVFASDVDQIVALMALADVAAKRVDAFPESGTHSRSCGTLVNI